ncbi:unnamed protein product [Urochloa humidicola]
MTHNKSAGTVAEQYLSNAQQGAGRTRSCESCKQVSRPPPTLRARPQMHPVAGLALAPPARDPAEAYPSPTTKVGRGGGPRQTKRSSRILSRPATAKT